MITNDKSGKKGPVTNRIGKIKIMSKKNCF